METAPKPLAFVSFLLMFPLAVTGSAAAEDAVARAASSAAEDAVARTASDPTLVWGPCPDFFPAGCEMAALHGDPAQPNADVFFRVPGHYELPQHWHSSAERMVLVSGELNVTYDGQDPIVLKPGSYAYGPPKAPHRGRCVSDEVCTLFIAFEGPVDALPGNPPAP